MNSNQKLHQTLCRRLEREISQNKQKSFLYYLPLELREELYRIQYTSSEFSFDTNKYSIIKTAWLTIYNEPRMPPSLYNPNNTVYFHSNILQNIDIDKLLENFYETGELYLQMDNIAHIKITDRVIRIKTHYPLDPRSHKFMLTSRSDEIEYPLSLEFINSLCEIFK
jgi:hypothetical protein